MSRFRCPNCKLPSSIDINKVYDGRLIFICSECHICALVPSTSNLDEAYLDFLDVYDSGHISEIQSLKSLMEDEKILRPRSEINSMILYNNAKDNEMLKGILFSQKDYVVDYRVIEEPEPELGNEVNHLPLDDAVIDALTEIKISRLYKFQEESVKNFLYGKDVAIVAPTATGKTEAFCVPVLQKIFEELSHFGSQNSRIGGKRKIFAIFVYPTKALAGDQLIKIRQLAEPVGIRVDIFDEAHVYTGVFGANVHYIIKRLERMSRNKKLQIIAASATMPNAEEFCTSLFGRKMDIVYGKGRRGKINFVILFPSLHSRRSLMIKLVKQTVMSNHKTIVFNKSHLGSELLAFYLSKEGLRIKVHRAGLLPKERKTVEQSFRNRELMAISATPTLELGIDIGDVDAIVSDIVPINRLIQRVGRAARGGQEGFAFLVLGNDPISQYYKLHPNDYLAGQELAYTDPSNPFVEEHQVLAMACDRPILMTESYAVLNTVRRLTDKGLLHLSNGRFVPDLKKVMAILRDFSIRGIGSSTDILFNGKLIGQRSMPQALEELHDNAVYFLSGKRYQVEKLHWDSKKEKRSYAELIRIPDEYPYYTRPVISEWPSIIDTYEHKRVFGIEVKFCSLKIQKRVLGYSNIEIGQDFAKGTKVMLENPIEFEFITKGFVFRAPRPVNTLKDAEDEQYIEMSGYHASEHVIIEGSTMITGGASQDLGGISLGSSGLIFIYDGTIGGNGASRALYDKFEGALERSLTILSECSCKTESGCPRCTYSYRCGNNNEYLQKIAATEILKRVSEGIETQIEDIMYVDRPLV